MNNLPFPVGVLHFVGIGGIGMSGIAEVMHLLGYIVQGSDIADNANVARLRAMGISVKIGHYVENLGAAQVVIISSAVEQHNPEVKAARSRFLPVVRRAEMLGELMRLKWGIAVGGTHGKTTTTSLIACILDGGHLDPTVINGGIINAYGTNARLGGGDWIVVEADESDGSFIKLPATAVVVTNIDPEHMDHYASFDAVRQAFESFVENIPFYGFAVLCIDHPEVQAMLPRVSDRRIITYGLSPQSDVRGINIRYKRDGIIFDAEITARLNLSSSDRAALYIKDIHLPMLGDHNLCNALAAIAVGLEIAVSPESIRTALAGFTGVKRRFTWLGEAGGITVIDDYGHHPIEISAVLRAARTAIKEHQGRVIAVVQPHRYTRLQHLFEGFCTCFNDADHVVVADVHAAGEEPIAGADRDHLVIGLRDHGHRSVHALKDSAQLAVQIIDLAGPGDMVVCLGAGNITNWAAALPGELSALQAGAVARVTKEIVS